MKDRFEYLDGLRGIAALIVVIHHGFLFFDFGLYSGVVSDAKFQPWDLWLSGKPILLLFFAGNFSVCVFFLLSGFVLAHAFSRSQASPFELMIKRYVRLTIPVTAANLLSLTVGLAALAIPVLQNFVPLVPGAVNHDFTLSNIFYAVVACFREALFTAPFTGIRAPTFNGVLWTMQIEFTGSVLLVMTFWLARRLSPSAILPAASAICAVFIALEWQSQISLLAAGVLFYWMVGTKPLKTSSSREVIGAALIFCGLYLGTMPESGLRPAFCNFLLGLSGVDPAAILSKSLVPWVPFAFLPVSLWHGAGAIVLLAGIFCSKWMRSVLSSRIAIFLGYISFPIYLVQASIRNLTAQPAFVFLTSHGVSATAAMFIAVAFFVAASTSVAWVFAKLVEGRSISWSGFLAKRLATPLSRNPLDTSGVRESARY